jgi:hypothetical protein
MKLLVVCSSLDLETPLSATPAWWQLLKGLYEVGVDLVVTTYHGRATSTPWWHAYPNPARVEGDLVAGARRIVRAGRGKIGVGPRITIGVEPQPRDPAATSRPPAGNGETARQKAERLLARTIVGPRWGRHLARVIEREERVDAVLLVSVPPNHLRGVAAAIRSTYRIPVAFYDGDVPASLPAYQGFASGFRIYDDADLSEFDVVLSNSEGGIQSLRDMGARAVETLHYAADPDLYMPLGVAQDVDVFFYGHTAEYRSHWIQALIAAPSIAMPDLHFAVRGRDLGDLGRATTVEGVPFNRLREQIARSRVNLAITREPHATTYASSTMRPFELAMMGACIVCNPYSGIERWFEPGKEIVVVRSTDEAVDRYRFLIEHEAERRAIGDAARRRALAEHTYRHRAARLVAILNGLTHAA